MKFDLTEFMNEMADAIATRVIERLMPEIERLRVEPTSPMLNTKDAAKFLGISPTTLEIWRFKGNGPAFIKIGRRVSYRQSDLDAYVTGRIYQSTTHVSVEAEKRKFR